jgi:uncharacterized protein YqjF (DUF2071 family)
VAARPIIVLGRLLDEAGELGERLSTRIAPSTEVTAQARATEQTAHRPWPLPDGPWLQGQTWRDLLFSHWPVAVEELRRVVPPELPIDTFDGSAWLGITPFRVTGLRLRGTPPPPLVSRFLETNVRTYVTLDERPGIWFLSLDAASRPAVVGARLTYRLPYFHATMAATRDAGGIRYRTARTSPPAALAVTYRPIGDAFSAAPGTLEHFLTERYRLYTLHRRRVLAADIHHPPWPLQPAEAEIGENTMTAPHGISLAEPPPVLHFSSRQDVVIWPLRPPGRTARST